jgi:hypothetical protein
MTFRRRYGIAVKPQWPSAALGCTMPEAVADALAIFRNYLRTRRTRNRANGIDG